MIADKGFAGAEFEQHLAALGGHLLRPDRKDELPRYGSLGGIRQSIESTFDTLKDQLSLERHGGRTLPGLISRIADYSHSPPPSSTTGRQAAPAAT